MVIWAGATGRPALANASARLSGRDRIAGLAAPTPGSTRANRTSQRSIGVRDGRWVSRAAAPGAGRIARVIGCLFGRTFWKPQLLDNPVKMPIQLLLPISIICHYPPLRQDITVESS